MAILKNISRKVKGISLLNEKFGEHQINLEEATVGDVLSKYLLESKKEIKPNSRLKVMSYNFPHSEWGNETNFIRACEEIYNTKGVRVRAVGGPDVEERESIKNLLEEDLIEGIRLLDSPPTYHFALIQPRLLWIENYHPRGENPKDCIFTPRAYDEVWEQANELFERYWNKGKPPGEL